MVGVCIESSKPHQDRTAEDRGRPCGAGAQGIVTNFNIESDDGRSRASPSNGKTVNTRVTQLGAFASEGPVLRGWNQVRSGPGAVKGVSGTWKDLTTT